MKGHDIEELFARHYDGELGTDELERFEERLRSSDTLRMEWERYREAMDALQGRGVEETSPELRAGLLAAVDQASAQEKSRARPIVPLLIGIGVGAAAAVLLLWFVPGLRRVEVRSEIVERTVEVPVEVPVEVVRTERVEVPVEVVRTERVEVPVEVPVEVFVPRGPLFDIDLQPLASALGRLTEQMGSAAATLGQNLENGLARAAVSTERAEPDPDASARRLPAPRALAVASAGAGDPAVRIRQVGDRVRIETSGSVADYVQPLIDQLDTASPAVRSAIEDRLASLHARASADPALRDRLVAPRTAGPREVDRGAGIFEHGRRRREFVEETAGQRWTDWWAGNEQILVTAALD